MAKEEKKDSVKRNTTRNNSSNNKAKENVRNTRKREIDKEEKDIKKKTYTRSRKTDNDGEKVRIKQLSFDEVVKPEEKKTKDTTKKFKTGDIALVVGLLVVVVIGLFVLGGEKPKPAYKLPLTLTGDAGLNLLSYKEYQEKIDNNESFVVVLSRESCSHCANFLPVAKAYAEDKKVPMYYVDTDTFTEDEWNTFEKSNSFLKEKSGNWGTPTTIVLAGSEAVDYIEGETTTDKLDGLYNDYFKKE